ncbi:hypothetical protein SAMN05216436_107114 [bacterium A37T11]|nr:hypothetical protein SAMN05216436_107114 [bacterium A37T11]
MTKVSLLHGSILLMAMILFSVTNTFCQDYGLTFQSYNVASEKRTSMDMTYKKDLCLKNHFKLSFDLSMIQQRDTYFGYIFRMVDDQQKNIDLIYEVDTLKLILAGRESSVLFRLAHTQLATWKKITIDFDTQRGTITLSTLGKRYTDSAPFLRQKACYKLLFGANCYRNFATTDVPPVRLKDIRIVGSGKIDYHWPLNESADSIAHERNGRLDGHVHNALWVKSEHTNWQEIAKLTVDGDASSCFNPKTGEVYVVSTDSIYAYQPDNQNVLAIESRSGSQNLHPGSQCLFLSDQQKILNFIVDTHAQSHFDLSSQQWDQHPFDPEQTIYWHVNKFYLPAKNSVFVFGGYGQHQYKNTIFQFTPGNPSWKVVQTKGDFFTPRYLAGLGTTSGADTVYLVGGYGSRSGKQAENPGFLYDMLRFTPQDGVIKQLYTLKTEGNDFVFGNDLIVDSRKKLYYGVIFNPGKYESSLQLVQGSLLSPDLRMLADTIPFIFHDTHSIVNLYYSEREQKLYLVTLLWSEKANKTSANIFQLAFPPAVYTPERAEPDRVAGKWWPLVIPALLLSLLGVWWLRRPHTPQVSDKVFEPIMPEEMVSVEPQKGAIYLFGDFQLFSETGEDMIKYFTPLLKEIFLLILLHSIRYKSGVSSEKLNELFWFDKSEKSARNNRSVNMAKLKSLLEKIGHCQLSKESGYWKIEVDSSYIYSDYGLYLQIVGQKTTINRKCIEELIAITKRGSFLSNMPFIGLDVFKSEISDQITNIYINYAHQTGIKKDPAHIVEITHHIFKFDPVSEEGMILQCKALVLLGKHSLAKSTYETFVKNYREIYQADYREEFQQILIY